MRNVEIKARVTCLASLLEKSKHLSGTDATVIRQHDTFYNVPNGRLKLRRFLPIGNGELIFYDRPDTEGPKICNFEKTDISSQSVESFNNVLVKALGAKNEIKKVRHLFIVGQTRVHVDEVENLGSFMELEVCLKPEQTLDEGVKIAHELMEKLGVDKSDLISGAYSDLLEKSL